MERSATSSPHLRESFVLESAGLPPIHGELFLSEESGHAAPASMASTISASSTGRVARTGVAVLIGGWLKFKEWGFYPYLAGALARRGYSCISFDPSHAGLGTQGSGVVIDHELARRHTPSRLLDDLSRLRQAIATGELGGGALDPRRVALVGHSMGASFAILHAVLEPGCFAVAGLSSMATLDRFGPNDARVMERDGFLELANVAAPPRRIYRAWLDDLRAHEDRLGVRAAVSRLAVPLLLVHGEENLGVPIAEAEELYHHAPKLGTRFVLLEKTGHSFGAAHPFRETTSDLERVLTVVGNFLDQSLPR